LREVRKIYISRCKEYEKKKKEIGRQYFASKRGEIGVYLIKMRAPQKRTI